jgi:arylsulfatase
MFNLRRDPFERADTDSNNYNHWWAEHIANMWPGAAVATEFFKTFEQFPPRQKPEKWNLSEVMERIQSKPAGGS